MDEYKKPRKGVCEHALSKVHSDGDVQEVRKDRLRDKVLFYWDANHQFLRLSMAPAKSPKNRIDDILKRKLNEYKATHFEQDIKAACDVLLTNIEKVESLRFVPLGDNKDRIALQKVLAMKINGDERDAAQLLEQIRSYLENDEIW